MSSTDPALPDNLSFDELALRLAEETEGTYFGSQEAGRDQKIALGKQIFEDVLGSVRPYLCQQWLTHSLASDEAKILASVGDLVVKLHHGVPVLVFTAMLLKWGLERVCGNQEQH